MPSQTSSSSHKQEYDDNAKIEFRRTKIVRKKKLIFDHDLYMLLIDNDPLIYSELISFSNAPF